MGNWRIYQGKGEPHEAQFPPPPPWRTFTGIVLNTLQFDSENDSYMKRLLARGAVFQSDEDEIEMVNAALYLRRPLLITGKPGCGKSSLAYSVARELRLGPVLRWSITSSTKLSDGLYHYDALGRLQDASLQKVSGAPPIGEYIRLGPLGAALLPSEKPHVLLIDEIDKSDIDLPNDLLHVFEEGEFEIPELVREEKKKIEVYYGKQGNTKVLIEEGRVCCHEFPFIVLTSNEEREFPPAFLRRCLRLEMKVPTEDKLKEIVKAHLGPEVFPAADRLIEEFVKEGKRGDLATDQLLNAVYLVSRGIDISRDKNDLFQAVLRHLSNV